MSPQDIQDPRTATAECSIWKDTLEDAFRTHLVTLEERTNAIIIQPQVFPLLDRSSSIDGKARLLPLKVEQSLADDLAYLAAIGEGAQSVSAVCLEECMNHSSLILRFAAIDAIDESLQHALQEIADTLTRSTTGEGHSDYAQLLLGKIVRLHFQKLNGRLRSSKWLKPKYLSRTHKKSLSQDFDNLAHRVQHVYPKKNNPYRAKVESLIHSLAEVVKHFEYLETGSSAEYMQLLKIVESSYEFCQNLRVRDFTLRLEEFSSPTSQIAAAIKTIRQIEKIGAYKRIAFDLTRTAKEYPTLFSSIELRYVSPYSAIHTDIGYEAWAKTLHVHAEIQLIVHYDLLSQSQTSGPDRSVLSFHTPRVIGTSKYLCYLCFQFITKHGSFAPGNTHGRLYDQWTIPDRIEFDENTIGRYRHIVADIDRDVITLSNSLGPREGKRDSWRVEPMTSRQNLLQAET